MGHIINAYKRDKIQAEHKVEILILKVEDLEHEVAYLKEKLKKFDRERSERKKRSREGSLVDGVIGSRGHHHHHHLDYEDDRHSLISSYDSAPWKSVPILSFTCVHQHKQPSQPHPLLHSQPHSPYHRPTMSLPVTPSPTSSLGGGIPSPLTSSPVVRVKSPRRIKSQDGAEMVELSNNVDRGTQSNVNVELDTIAEEGGVKSNRTNAGVEQHDSGRGSSYTPGSTPRVSGYHRKESSDVSDRYSPICGVSGGEAMEAESSSVECGLSPVSLDNEDEPDDDEELDELSEIERVTKVIFHPTIERSKDVPVTVL